MWLSQVRLSQVREEKVAEEWSKKKLLKKHGEADARKQKVPSVVRATLGPSCMWKRKGVAGNPCTVLNGGRGKGYCLSCCRDFRVHAARFLSRHLMLGLNPRVPVGTEGRDCPTGRRQAMEGQNEV